MNSIEKYQQEIETILYNNNLITENNNNHNNNHTNNHTDIIINYSVHIEVTRTIPYLCLEMYSEITTEPPNENYWMDIIKKWNKCFKNNNIDGIAELIIVKNNPYYLDNDDDGDDYDNN